MSKQFFPGDIAVLQNATNPGHFCHDDTHCIVTGGLAVRDAFDAVRDRSMRVETYIVYIPTAGSSVLCLPEQLRVPDDKASEQRDDRAADGVAAPLESLLTGLEPAPDSPLRESEVWDTSTWPKGLLD